MFIRINKKKIKKKKSRKLKSGIHPKEAVQIELERLKERDGKIITHSCNPDENIKPRKKTMKFYGFTVWEYRKKPIK